MGDFIVVVNEEDGADFTNKVNSYLSLGYTVSSTSCGFVNSESYDFMNVYQAILIKKGAIKND